MKKKSLLTGLILTSCFWANAQYNKVAISPTAKIVSQGTKSAEFTAQLMGEIIPISVDLKWKPFLIKKCIKHHTENDELLDQIKSQKMLSKNNSSFKTNETENSAAAATVTPVVGSNFLGNTNTGNSPLDNSVAISNGGKIVSVANNSIEFYNTSGTMTFTNSIDGFFNDPTITNVCDPRCYL